ncbi:MAG TPA: bifunctional YncE family protein/alkaline phosphatase family protein [Solirubrobacteraceae bacterium]|nr:bifunctional YncE family protein/alkaline phosphatase family protein [Solirubrobacteraceae bacterium]
MARRHRTLGLVLAAVALPGAGIALAGDDNADPSQRSLPSGRVLQPQGQAVPLGAFPVGGAVTPDGRFAWAISILRRSHQLRIVSVERKAPVQTLTLATATGGIAMDPVRNRAYVAFADGVRVYTWNRQTGRARLAGFYSVPRPPGHPGDNPRRGAFAGRLAVAPDGRRLLVPLSLADTAAIVDTRTRRVTYVPAGSHPYGAAILRNGRVGLVTNEGTGTVTAIDMRSGAHLADIQVGPSLSHPLSIAVDPRTDRAYVPVAHADQVVVIDTRRLRVERSLSVGRSEGLGTMPIDATTSRDGAYLLVAEAGADELAVFRLPAPGRKRTPGAFGLIGRIPVADYPVNVDTTPVRLPGCPDAPRAPRAKTRGQRRTPAIPRATTQRCERIVWIAAQGFGSTPNPFGPTPYRVDNANIDQAPSEIVTGFAGVLGFPTDRRIRALTATASAQVRPSNPASPPPGTPLRAGGPIRHVFFIVRENRTYDQVLGDVARGNGDPQLTLFGNQVTPNIHALVARFPLLDGVRANSDTSTDGHLWTTAARVSDYVQRNWIQTYDPDGRPQEVFSSIRWPASGFLFDQADRQGISYFNYGEAIAGTVEGPDADLTPAAAAQRANRARHSDLGPPNGCYGPSLYSDHTSTRRVYDSSPVAGSPPNVLSRYECFKSYFQAQVASNSVPAFNYLILPEDHTQGITPGLDTPRALVAQNDYGLGQIVDLISHSSIWGRTAIFSVEDDSQNGADHVDAHRIPALAISPYAKPGAVVHARYDLPSVIRSMELILGMRPLGLMDALATPMYDAFSASPANAAPFNAVPPTWNLLETNPPRGALARRGARRGVLREDSISQGQLDAELWRSVHGPRSKPPPAGPNANAGQ